MRFQKLKWLGLLFFVAAILLWLRQTTHDTKKPGQPIHGEETRFTASPPFSLLTHLDTNQPSARSTALVAGAKASQSSRPPNERVRFPLRLGNTDEPLHDLA